MDTATLQAVIERTNGECDSVVGVVDQFDTAVQRYAGGGPRCATLPCSPER